MNIVVLCKRKHTDYARITLMLRSVRVEYGNFENGGFRPIYRDEIPYGDAPELAFLHDGVGWNLLDLADLVRECRDGEIGAGVHVVLGKDDVDLLHSVGLEIA